MSHKIPNFPSTTGVLQHFICPKFVFGQGPPHSPPPRRLDLGVPNVTVSGLGVSTVLQIARYYLPLQDSPAYNKCVMWGVAIM